MTGVKNIWGSVLFYYDENTTTLAEEISKHKNLRWARLMNASLKGVNLSETDLMGADLRGADLSNADLRDANLRDASLRDANLKGAKISYADLRWADLMGADLSGADLRNANLCCTKNVPDGLPMACPEEGSFVAWKKVGDNYLIKLEIPEDAKRSSATTKKCRCNKAKVLEITDLFTDENVDEVVNANYALCTYTVGEMAYPDWFDNNRWNECSHGIHFFVNRDDAVNY